MQDHSHPLRIGCVPYLNAKPLVDWFHSDTCDADAHIVYGVPSELARRLEAEALDTALVSTFELFRKPELVVLPGMSISATGAVKSVRLFSQVPFAKVQRVALDTSSLTSTALTRILLREQYGVCPEYVDRPPDLAAMLADCDAGLIIGDLKLFDTPAAHILDLGAAWHDLTGLPFVYAGWLARPAAPLHALTSALERSKAWGCAHLYQLSHRWSARMELPLERVEDYFQNVMDYGLGERQWEGLIAFQRRCVDHGLIAEAAPLRRA